MLNSHTRNRTVTKLSSNFAELSQSICVALRFLLEKVHVNSCGAIAMKFLTLSSLIASLAPLSARADEALGMAKPWQLGFQSAATPVMERLTWLHETLLLWIISGISVFVLLLMIYIIARFNKRAHPVPTTTTHNTVLEIIWTVIPVLILVAIVIPSIRTHYFMERAPQGGITLKVVGHQWYWSYEYPEFGGVAFDSYIVKDEDLKPGNTRLLSVDNEVVVPVNTPVHVHITGADVIHSWAVPAFGIKRDGVPGRLNETWFEANKTGTFYGQCSELCGVGHGFMPIAVRVVSKEAFASWIAQKQKDAGIAPGTKTAGDKPELPEIDPAPKPANVPTAEVPDATSSKK